MLVLPRITIPAFFNFLTTVESYGGIQPSNIFDPQVFGTPFWVNTSLRARGTPAKDETFLFSFLFLSTSSACFIAPVLSTCKKDWTDLSKESIRSR